MQILETKPETSDWEYIELATDYSTSASKSNSERIQSNSTVLINKDKTFLLFFYTSDDRELLRSNLTSKSPDMAKKANTLNPKERRKDPSSTRYTSIPIPAKPAPPPKGYNPQKVGTCLLPVATGAEDDEQLLTSLDAKLLKRRQKIESAQEHSIPGIISTENVTQRTQPTCQTTDDIPKQDGAEMKQEKKSSPLGRPQPAANKPVNPSNLDQKDDQLQAILKRRRKLAES